MQQQTTITKTIQQPQQRKKLNVVRAGQKSSQVSQQTTVKTIRAPSAPPVNRSFKNQGRLRSSLPQGIVSPWLLKSLDPAGVPGNYGQCSIPDGTTKPLSAVEWITTARISDPGTTASTLWDLDLYTIPNPLIMSCYQARNESTAQSTTSRILNQQLGALNNDYDFSELFANVCELYRISYMSITTQLNCTALTNQGMVYAAQYVYPNYEVYMTPTYTTTESGVTPEAQVVRLVQMWDRSDDKSYQDLIQIPSSYKGRAEEGTYSVLKLGQESRKWTPTNDTRAILTQSDDDLSKLSHSDVNVGFTGLVDSSAIPYGVGSPVASATSWGHAYPRVRDPTCLKTSFVGLSHESTIDVKIILGIEMIARPGSTVYPYMQYGSPYNDLALVMHDTAWRGFYDAYPADYNALGKFGPALAKILESVGKVVKAGVGIVAPEFSPLLNLVSPLGSKVVRKLKS